MCEPCLIASAFSIIILKHFSELILRTNPYVHVLASFQAWEGTVPPGYKADFLGNLGKIERFYASSPAYLEKLKSEAQVPTFQLVAKPDPTTASYYEVGAVLQCVYDAGDSFTMMELGAGMAPWTVMASAAAKQRGIQERHFVVVEAEPTRFEWLKENLEANGISSHEYLAKRGVVFPADQKGRDIYFPSGQPNFAGHMAITDANLQQRLNKYAEREMKVNMEPATVISLADILNEVPSFVFDLGHFDIQGAEYDVLRDQKERLNARFRAMVIGTHSPRIHTDVHALMESLGWRLIFAFPYCESFEVDGVRIPGDGLDGLQHWINPSLQSAKSNSATRGNP